MNIQQIDRDYNGEVFTTFIVGALVAGLTALFITGCASAPASSASSASLKQAKFTPTENPGMSEQEQHSVTYNVPISTQPEGKIEVISKGIESIRSHKSNKDLPALHVQLIVTNDQKSKATSRTWMLDARSQRLRLRSDLLLRPALVEAEAVALPMIEVRAGQTSKIDLYYAIPKELQTSSSLPGFEIEWQIQTPRRLVSRMTKFNQEMRNQSTADVYPFDRSSRLGREADYPAMDPALAPDANPLPPGNYQLRQGPATDATWWADPFTEFPFPWRDMVY